MEDQVGKLRELGLRAERIHSGRERSASRQACVDYLAGRLDYLFIAPERLSVPGFPEMLAKRIPALIAVDEAHCISQWWARLPARLPAAGGRLPLLRPAPVIALTATRHAARAGRHRRPARPRPRRALHPRLPAYQHRRRGGGDAAFGPRRNRPRAAGRPRAPAGDRLRAHPQRGGGPRHAPARRLPPPPPTTRASPTTSATACRRPFLSGRLEVIVATIAFGMGRRQGEHPHRHPHCMPGSVEGYYQEIGRAGRDGLPSRAILLYSYNDRRSHEWFHNRIIPRLPSSIASSAFSSRSRRWTPDSQAIGNGGGALRARPRKVVDSRRRPGGRGWQRRSRRDRGQRLAAGLRGAARS